MTAIKQDRLFWMCIDYETLDAVTVRDKYPHLRIEECNGIHGNAAIISTLVANRGYWLVSAENEDKDERAFLNHKGKYRYYSKSFGLMNATVTFQR